MLGGALAGAAGVGLIQAAAGILAFAVAPSLLEANAHGVYHAWSAVLCLACAAAALRTWGRHLVRASLACTWSFASACFGGVALNRAGWSSPLGVMALWSSVALSAALLLVTAYTMRRSLKTAVRAYRRSAGWILALLAALVLASYFAPPRIGLAGQCAFYGAALLLLVEASGMFRNIPA